MKLNDQELRGLVQRGTERRGARDSCPSSDELVLGALGELSGDRRAKLADHLIECSDCSKEILLVQLPEDPRGLDSRRFVPRVAWWRRVTAVAAGLVLCASLLWLLSPRSTDDPPFMRGEAHVTDPAFALDRIEPPHEAVLDAFPEVLAWQAARPGASFRVDLYDFEMTELWKSPILSSSTATIPAEVRERMVRGRRYFWRLSMEKGLERKESKLFEFSISP